MSGVARRERAAHSGSTVRWGIGSARRRPRLCGPQHLLRRLSLLFFSSWTRPNFAASALDSFCASIHLYLPDFECHGFFKQSSMPRCLSPCL